MSMTTLWRSEEAASTPQSEGSRQGARVSRRVVPVAVQRMDCMGCNSAGGRVGNCIRQQEPRMSV
uniref:Macaca fascicularis brain cDNA clone: QflA-19004, similar to human centaurin, beta 2 (CENTB2), mRNA, RefSeq: NM_012287.3 n=1 Tax=Macaca fascicularis TaxID=9541 RepID=I7GID0_MACFA|nr:unnamed protein product [Macaca fascicularis]